MPEKFTPIPEQIAKETRGLRNYDMVLLASTLTVYPDKNNSLNQFLEFSGLNKNDIKLVNNSLREIASNRDKYPIRHKSIYEVLADQESGYIKDRAIKALEKMREISNTKDDNWELITCAFSSINKSFEFDGEEHKDSLEYIEKIVKKKEPEYNPELDSVVEIPKSDVVFILPDVNGSKKREEAENRERIYTGFLYDYFNDFKTIDPISGAKLTRKLPSLNETFLNKWKIKDTKNINITNVVFLRYCSENVKGGLSPSEEKSIRKEIKNSYTIWFEKEFKESK